MSARGPLVLSVLAAALAVALAGCATRPPPITKLVNGRVITTRAINADAYEHVSRALIFEEDERWSDAAAELQRALIHDSDAPEVHAHLAELFLRLDRLDDAASAVKASLAVAVTVDGLTAEAHLRQTRGDAAGAVASLERAAASVSFTEDPAQAEDTYLELGDAALLALDAERARRAYDRLCSAAPESLVGRLRLAAVTWAMGDIPETERRFKEALALEPNQLDALLSLAWLYAATGRVQDARNRFAEALDRSEGAPEVAAAFARFLVAIGKTKEAEDVADDLPAIDVTDGDAVLRRAEVERAARRWDKAQALVKTAHTADLPPETKARLPVIAAQLLADQDKRSEAVTALLAIPKGSAARLEARLRAAEILREDGKTVDAAAALGDVDAGGIEAQEIELAVSRALVDDRRGDTAQGIRRLEEALGRRPGSPRLTLTLASLEERRGRWQQALALTEKLLAKEPGSVEALNFWGFVAADHGHDLARAGKRLVSALALDPGSAAIIDSVGWVHFKRGDVTRAALFLEQAGRLDPEDPEVLAHLGELYVRRAENERAVVAFRKALSHRPDDALRRRVEEELSRLESSRKAARP